MIFGHQTTSHDIQIKDNVFAYDGCIQNRGDRGGIAVMCPGGHKPSGVVSGNHFYLCLGNLTPAIYVNPATPGCAENLTMINNEIDGAQKLVVQPQVSFNPPSPNSNATSGKMPVLGVTTTLNATVRYTLDGSRPTETSPIVPAAGIMVAWPGPVVCVNMRAFKAGWTPSVTNGAVVEANYIFGRASEVYAFDPGGLGGKADGFIRTATTTTVHGWVVDYMMSGHGIAPVSVSVTIDGAPVMSYLANEARADLVPAGVAPNARHGFTCVLSAAAHAALAKGRHAVNVLAIGTPSASIPTPLPESAGGFSVCDGKLCPDTKLQLKFKTDDDATVQLKIGKSVHKVSPYFRGFNIDMSPNREFFSLDFSSPHLIYLAKSLASTGAFLRIGGTGNDYVEYGDGSAATSAIRRRFTGCPEGRATRRRAATAATRRSCAA